MATIEEVLQQYDLGINEHLEKLQYDALSYYRVTKDHRGVNRGHIFLLDSSGEEIIREISSFPHINRVYRLDEGIQHFFGSDRFHVEQKLDGYNTRIFLHDEEIYATTKGGFLCPFTTEWARLWGEIANLNAFFADHPDWLLCAEVAGHNPYNGQWDPAMPDGAQLFIFDILPNHQEFLNPAKRYEIIDKYHLPGVPVYGEYSHERVDELRDILLRLNEEEREGVVMKKSGAEQYLKFVTPTSDLQDIRDSFQLNFDMHPYYFRNRLLRSILFIQEFDLNEQKYATEIGKAFLESLEDLKDFEKTQEEFTIFVQDTNTWRRTRSLISGQVDIKTRSLDYAELYDRKMIRVDFSRVYEQSTNRYQSILQGFPHTD